MTTANASGWLAAEPSDAPVTRGFRKTGQISQLADSRQNSEDAPISELRFAVSRFAAAPQHDTSIGADCNDFLPIGFDFFRVGSRS
jgi:hypothetical protein